MPFTYEIVAILFGCVGLRLGQQFNGWGLAAVYIQGAINMRYYSHDLWH